MTQAEGFPPSARPVIHFTPQSGWMNDPNGLVHAHGLWHLYFQHNPYGNSWGHIGWGHAVSADLSTWRQYPDVLYPDGDGMAFSGSAIVNDRGLLGLPSDALLYFYTAAGHTTPESAGKDYVQKTAYSTDGGRTLRLLQEPALPAVEHENRDPKVFWHAQSAAYILCLWLKDSDFGLFRSTDLRTWTLSQRLTLPGGFECPDLFALPVDSGPESVWVFWTASGAWYAGTFDGFAFRWDGETHGAYATPLPYAAQTFANTPGRTLSVPWLRCDNRARPYTGAMGLPRALSLTRRNGRLQLCQPVAEEILRRFKPYARGRQAALPTNGVLLMETTVDTPCDLHWDLGGYCLRYSWAEGAFFAQGGWIPASRFTGTFALILDGTLLEITGDSAIIYAAIDIPVPLSANTVRIEAGKNGVSRFSALR